MYFLSSSSVYSCSNFQNLSAISFIPSDWVICRLAPTNFSHKNLKLVGDFKRLYFNWTRYVTTKKIVQWGKTQKIYSKHLNSTLLINRKIWIPNFVFPEYQAPVEVDIRKIFVEPRYRRYIEHLNTEHLINGNIWILDFVWPIFR